MSFFIFLIGVAGIFAFLLAMFGTQKNFREACKNQFRLAREGNSSAQVNLAFLCGALTVASFGFALSCLSIWVKLCQ